MAGITNFLTTINENWTAIVTIAVLVFSIYKKAKASIEAWRAKTDEEKKAAIKEAQDKAEEAARAALGDFILALVARAEIDWADAGSGIGPIKRAEVIEKIYDKYPVLLNVADKEELIAYIDALIVKSLEIVRETVRKELKKKAEAEVVVAEIVENDDAKTEKTE